MNLVNINGVEYNAELTLESAEKSDFSDVLALARHFYDEAGRLESENKGLRGIIDGDHLKVFQGQVDEIEILRDRLNESVFDELISDVLAEDAKEELQKQNDEFCRLQAEQRNVQALHDRIALLEDLCSKSRDVLATASGIGPQGLGLTVMLDNALYADNEEAEGPR